MASITTPAPGASATREFLENLRALPRNLKNAWFPVGHPPASAREESQATFHNLFLHIHSVRVRLRTVSGNITIQRVAS